MRHSSHVCSTSPSYTPHLSEGAATALCKHHACPCQKRQVLISEPLTRWKSSIRKGNGKRVLEKTSGARMTQARRNAQDSLAPQTLGKVILSFPSPNSFELKRWRGKEPALSSLIPMQRCKPCFSQQTGGLRICKERRSQQEEIQAFYNNLLLPSTHSITAAMTFCCSQGKYDSFFSCLHMYFQRAVLL